MEIYALWLPFFAVLYSICRNGHIKEALVVNTEPGPLDNAFMARPIIYSLQPARRCVAVNIPAGGYGYPEPAIAACVLFLMLPITVYLRLKFCIDVDDPWTCTQRPVSNVCDKVSSMLLGMKHRWMIWPQTLLVKFCSLFRPSYYFCFLRSIMETNMRITCYITFGYCSTN